MKIVKNYLNDHDINVLVDLSHAVHKHPDMKSRFRSSYGGWDHSIIQYSPPVLIWDIPGDFLEQNGVVLLKYDELKNADRFMLYFWPPGSYIPWHNDSHTKGSGTIYLNKTWNRDWGGFLCWDRGNNEYDMMVPEYNTMALNNYSQDSLKRFHSVTPVTKPLYFINDNGEVVSEMRSTLQFFCTNQ